jgi:hypothetical protein
MEEDQRRALERVRDACAVLRCFMHTRATGVPVQVRYATYRQLTGDLMQAVSTVRCLGVPERLIFDNM